MKKRIQKPLVQLDNAQLRTVTGGGKTAEKPLEYYKVVLVDILVSG